MKNDYEVLVSRLTGLSTWGLVISVGGMTIEFGSRREQEGMILGDFTVWIRTRFRVVCDRKPILETDYPHKEHRLILASFRGA
jgi:hypothetical protein